MYRTLLVMGLLVATQAGVSQSRKKALDDSTLDRVTAAGVTTRVLPGGVINFTGEVPTANGLVSGIGSLVVQPASSSTNTTTTGTVNLGGSAQQNLSSLININAANSTINVLLNLNVNINSTVGTILQSNLNGKMH
ncbi:MAG TPA: hypothetical protein VN734_08575 [Acidobacteriaceae bacterium]|nr:hypothetical protein [Acidobacteriaceae bacterium]